MNWIPIKSVDRSIAECSVCSGSSFHITRVNDHYHFMCANPICNQIFCIEGECLEGRIHCPYCGSGLIDDGNCQKCGL